MIKSVLGFCGIMILGSQCLAQTPTPIQPRKNTTTQIQSNSTFVKPQQVDKKIPDYCATSFRVFRGTLVYSDGIYSLKFKFKLCFTDGNEIFDISRIVLVPNEPNYIKNFVNQEVKMVLMDFKMVKIADAYEVLASDYLIGGEN